MGLLIWRQKFEILSDLNPNAGSGTIELDGMTPGVPPTSAEEPLCILSVVWSEEGCFNRIGKT